MALYDWNHDGKKDMQDDFIEYHVYKECTKDSDNNSSYGGSSYKTSSGNGASAFWVLIIVFAVLYVCAQLGAGTDDGRCSYAGCDNEAVDGRNYCWLHMSGSSSTNRTGSSSTNRGGSSSTTGYAGTTEASTETSDYKSGSTTSYHDYSSDEDPYDAKDYSDAEDFYYDNYDDFYEYEEAEDYYDEWGE